MAYKHVLAAVDLSEEANQVLREARQVADDHGAKLSILSVVKPLAQVYGGLDMAAYTQASVNFEREAQAHVVEKLRSIGAELGVAPDDTRAAIGAPAPQVVESAKDLDVDLIVIGSHGKHGLGLLLGSTANGVLHHATCDVLTVRIKD
ncbi:MAG: universal stress protein [Pseudomonadales bacterium]